MISLICNVTVLMNLHYFNIRSGRLIRRNVTFSTKNGAIRTKEPSSFVWRTELGNTSHERGQSQGHGIRYILNFSHWQISHITHVGYGVLSGPRQGPSPVRASPLRYFNPAPWHEVNSPLANLERWMKPKTTEKMSSAMSETRWNHRCVRYTFQSHFGRRDEIIGLPHLSPARITMLLAITGLLPRLNWWRTGVMVHGTWPGNGTWGLPNAVVI